MRSPRIALRFERVIDAHERHHVKIAERYARLMERRLKKLKADKSCWTVRARAGEVLADLKKRHIQAQKRFDRKSYRQISRLL